MTFEEKSLYHQIHPLKLFTDISTALVSIYFFWNHEIWIALAISFIPSIIVTVIIIKFFDLSKYKDSAFGKYISKYMTKPIMGIRFLGLFLMIIGAWVHQILLILFGIIVIILAWTYGLINISKRVL